MTSPWKHSCTIVGILTAAAFVSACNESPLEPGHFGLSPDAGQGRTVKMVPFKAHHTAQPADAGDLDCPTGPGRGGGRTTFEGTATHLGKYTGGAFACFVFTSPVTLVSTSGGLVMNGANGDQLQFTGDPENPGLWVFDPSTAVLTSSGGMHVTGGTGRFEGATGYVTISTTRADFPANLFTETTIEGRISSPGSIKWGNP